MQTTYEVQPVSPAAVAFILKHLWDRGRQELADHRISSGQALVTAMLSAEKAGAVSGVLLADGVPVMVAGVVPEGDEAVTWFLATDDFDKHYKISTKMLRRYSKEYPMPVSIYSTVPHEQAPRWFRALGYEKDPQWVGCAASGRPLTRFRRK